MNTVAKIADENGTKNTMNAINTLYQNVDMKGNTAKVQKQLNIDVPEVEITKKRAANKKDKPPKVVDKSGRCSACDFGGFSLKLDNHDLVRICKQCGQEFNVDKGVVLNEGFGC